MSGDCGQSFDLLLCPAGDGDTFETNTVIGVIVRDSSGDPVEWFPREDVAITWTDLPGPLTHCGPSTFIADDNTDQDGFTSITNFGWWPGSGNIVDNSAGGWTTGSTLSAYVLAFPIEPVLETFHIVARSPDIDGSGAVDLVDVALLAEDFAGNSDPSLWFRSDFDRNGAINLVDIGEFALHLGHHCR